jgi:hypothetical protein
MQTTTKANRLRGNSDIRSTIDLIRLGNNGLRDFKKANKELTKMFEQYHRRPNDVGLSKAM